MQRFTSSNLGEIVHCHRFLILSVLFFPLVFCSQTMAMNFDLGKELTLDMDVHLTYAAAMRLEDPDNDLLTNVNTDDGNRNFDQGDLVNNKFSVLMDIDLNRDNVGLFVRPRAFYDFAYDDDKFSDDTQDRHRDTAEILDAFAYGTFDVSGHDLDIRVGRQVVNWGESLYLTGGISSAMNPMDATIATAPGIEVKELFLPTGQVSAKVDLWKNVSLSGFAKFEWDKTRLPEAGSYFSAADMLDDAGEKIIVSSAPAPFAALNPVLNLLSEGPTIDRVSDKDASDSGEFGISLSYVADQLNGTEFSFYYMNYHEKTPMVINDLGSGGTSKNWAAEPVTLPNGMTVPLSAALAGMGMDAAQQAQVIGGLTMMDSSSYHLEYAEDVKLYGLSIGTEIADASVGVDVSYRTDYPVALSDGTYTYAEDLQAQINAIYSLGRAPFLWDSWLLQGGIGFNHVYGLDGDEKLSADEFAWGGSASLSLDFFYILPELDMKTTFSYKFNPNGTAVNAAFTENKDSLGVAFDFTYKQDYKFGVNYVAFIGSASDNNLTDRDYIGFNFKYSF